MSCLLSRICCNQLGADGTSEGALVLVLGWAVRGSQGYSGPCRWPIRFSTARLAGGTSGPGLPSIPHHHPGKPQPTTRQSCVARLPEPLRILHLLILWLSSLLHLPFKLRIRNELGRVWWPGPSLEA